MRPVIFSGEMECGIAATVNCRKRHLDSKKVGDPMDIVLLHREG